jgi:hypothetical protein
MSINFIPYRKDNIRTVSNSTSSAQVKNEYEPDFLSPWRLHGVAGHICFCEVGVPPVFVEDYRLSLRNESRLKCKLACKESWAFTNQYTIMTSGNI